MSEGVYRTEYVEALALLARASTMVRSGGGLAPVLVGGAVVEFDTASQIVSGDFDFVSVDDEAFVDALTKLGFEQGDGFAFRKGAFLHPALGIGVELVLFRLAEEPDLSYLDKRVREDTCEELSLESFSRLCDEITDFG